MLGLLVLGCALMAALLRQEGVPKWRTIWAEDGAVFLQCAFERPLLACLGEPYAGYLHVVPRLAAAVVAPGEPEGLPLRLAVLAGLVAATAAILAALAVFDVTRSRLAGILAGAGLVLVEPAAVEVLGNLANLHWVLLAASVVVVACMWLGRAPRVADLVLLAATTLSSPIGPFLLVPMALLAFATGSPGARVTITVVVASSLIQLGVIATHPRVPSVGPAPSVRAMLGWTKDAVIDSGWFGKGYPIANLVVMAATAASVCLLAWRRHLRPALVVAVIASAGLVTLLVSLYLAHAPSSRYAYVLAALSVCALALGSGLLASRLGTRPGALVMPAIVATVGVGFAVAFRVPTYASDGPDVVPQIASASCSDVSTSVEIDIAPSPWRMWIPCPPR